MAKEKEKHIKNTSRVLETKGEKMKFLGRDFIILENVFNPKNFPSTEWFSKELIKIIGKSKMKFLEMGCGSGMISISLGMKNKKIKITSTDINPKAIENTKINIVNYGLQESIKIKKSDVFENFENEKFDIIFWSMPFGYINSKKTITLLERAVFDPGYNSIKRFISESKNHLLDNGKILIGFSKDIGDFQLLKKICDKNNLRIKLISETQIQEGENKIGMEIYELI